MSASTSPTQEKPLSPSAKSPVKFPFLIPSPIVTRRTRTLSLCRLAAESPEKNGVILEFCRNKGHGFITPDDSNEKMFVHISDIEGEYIPVAGDRVTYRECPIPPKHNKVQAVEVVITHLASGTKHHKWQDPDDS